MNARPGRAARFGLAAAAVLALVSGPADAGALAVRVRGAWRTWWRAEAAPARWTAADSTLTAALRWRRAAPGVEWAEAELAGEAPAWRMRLVVARLDPARVRCSLALDLAGRDGRPAWTLDRAPAGALLAVNAGQFVQTLPWGWLVLAGAERLAPGGGPLATALAFDAAGRPHWLGADSLAAARARVRWAFQSYPTLLRHDGEVPEPLRVPGRGVDLRHRDARLAIGEDRAGRLLVAITRYDALGPAAGALPIGPTTPEMAALLGALGARDAVMLDGGLSAQLLVREGAGGRTHRWPGLRRVPLALVAEPR